MVVMHRVGDFHYFIDVAHRGFLAKGQAKRKMVPWSDDALRGDLKRDQRLHAILRGALFLRAVCSGKVEGGLLVSPHLGMGD